MSDSPPWEKQFIGHADFPDVIRFQQWNPEKPTCNQVGFFVSADFNFCPAHADSKREVRRHFKRRETLIDRPSGHLNYKRMHPYSEPSAKLLTEETEYTKKLRVLLKGIIQNRDKGQPAHRALHPRSIGFAHAQFEVLPDIAPDLAVGLFARPDTYPARIRFSNANAGFDADSARGIRGMALKLYNVTGERLVNDDPSNPGFDFIMNSHTHMPVKDVKGFYEMNYHFAAGTILKYFFHPFDSHLATAWSLIASARQHNSPLDARYWSMTPYRLGTQKVVKYSLTPTSAYRTPADIKQSATHLQEAFEAHLKQNPATFDFQIQVGSGPEHMPIEDASVEWNESRAPFQTVARLTIPVQDTGTEELKTEGELLAFNPWHVTAEHEPLGGINRARGTIYTELSAFRLKKRAQANAKSD